MKTYTIDNVKITVKSDIDKKHLAFMKTHVNVVGIRVLSPFKNYNEFFKYFSDYFEFELVSWELVND